MDETKISLLLVDDDPDLLSALDRTFRREGFRTIKAVSAEEATSILRHYKVDAILCDNQMVGTSGTSFLAQVKYDHPMISRFMLTGDISSTQSWLLLNDIGVDGMFEKPCEPSLIVDAIHQAMTVRDACMAQVIEQTLR
ncbi:MAG: response regulator [Planctomycetota bacterium]